MPELLIELRVRNHPGAMSHVTGLFARRAFNIERVLCVPEGGGATSRVLLTVRAGVRPDQVLRQAGKLQDVLAVRLLPGDGAGVFAREAAALGAAAGGP